MLRKWTYRHKSDEELVGLFLSDRRRILAEIYRRYAHLCYGVALKYLQDPVAAQDAVADIFLKLDRDLDRHEIQTFRTWFYVLSKNHCLGVIRKEKTIKKHESKWETERDRSPYESDIIDGRMSAMDVALQELKQAQRECIKAFYFEKRSYTEIADNLNLSVKQVKSHLQNGKRNLRMSIESKQSSKP